MLTEQSNPNSAAIDTLDSLGIVTRINAEDRTVAEAVAQALPAIAQAIDVIVERMGRGGRLFYVGAGTSGRLGVLDASECPPTYGVAPEKVQGVIAGGQQAVTESLEDAEDDRDGGKRDLAEQGLNKNDVVVGIAASGSTPYVLGAVDYAHDVGAATIGIANNQPSALLDAAQIAIPILTGAEVVAGSTRMKAGTGQKMVLNMLSTGVMIRLGKVYGNLMVDVQAKNKKLRERAIRIVAQIGRVDAKQAADLLEQTEFNTKVAIVMARRGVDVEQAHTLLAEANGFLRQIIDSI